MMHGPIYIRRISNLTKATLNKKKKKKTKTKKKKKKKKKNIFTSKVDFKLKEETCKVLHFESSFVWC